LVRALIATSGAALALSVVGCGSGRESTSTGTLGQGALAGIWMVSTRAAPTTASARGVS